MPMCRNQRHIGGYPRGCHRLVHHALRYLAFQRRLCAASYGALSRRGQGSSAISLAATMAFSIRDVRIAGAVLGVLIVAAVWVNVAVTLVIPPTLFPSAEAWTTPTADFDVRVLQPRGLRVLASGRQVGRRRWQARAVRDFTLALGHFTVVTGTAHVPGAVRVTAGLEPVPGATPARVFLQRAITSLERYSALYAPYPWPAFTVV